MILTVKISVSADAMLALLAALLVEDAQKEAQKQEEMRDILPKTIAGAGAVDTGG
jgi:hypothetical protein